MQETPKYYGLQGVDISTSKFLLKPGKAWEVTESCNRGRDISEWIGLEVYPTRKMTPEYAQKLLETYPHTVVRRVHLEFNYSLVENLHRIALGEIKNGPMHMLFQAAWLLIFKTANKLHGVNLAESLGVGINVHTNVIAGFAKDHRLEQLSQLPFVLAENERKFNSLLLEDQRLAYDPVLIAERLVEEEKLAGGILLGLDHPEGRIDDFIRILRNPLIRRYTETIHLAQVGTLVMGQRGHGEINPKSAEMRQLLWELKQTPFSHPVRATLNYVTKLRGGGPTEQQAQELSQMVNWIMSTQRSNDPYKDNKWDNQMPNSKLVLSLQA